MIYNFKLMYKKIKVKDLLKLITSRGLIIYFNNDYLKKESTNSNLLNTCRSSIPSPTPMYLTGIWN